MRDDEAPARNGVSNLEVVGGVPLISVMGTPRTIGDTLGRRLKPRLQVLCQYVAEQLAGRARRRGLDLAALRGAMRPCAEATAKREPSLWMELESMAGAVGVPVEDLLLVHGHSDLFGYLACEVPAAASTYLAFAATQTESQAPCAALVTQLDPALTPYLTLIHRIPSHGPSSLALTFCGLHPVLGMTEAGLAVASNEMRVDDGAPGQLTTHLIASTLNAPGFAEVLSRLQAGPRYGGRALHALSADGERATIECTGTRTARLSDPLPTTPRVHTNHPLADEIVASGTVLVDPVSKSRLGRVAGFAIGQVSVRPSDIVGCFGVLPTAGSADSHDFTPRSSKLLRDEDGITAPDSVVFVVMDPRHKQLHVRRGFANRPLEIARL